MKLLKLLVATGFAAVLVSCVGISGTNTQAKPLAMMFQVMNQLEHLVETKDLGSIHHEEAIVGAAVNELLEMTNLVEAARVDSFKRDLTAFAQQVGALHQAGDLNQQTQAEEALGKLKVVFEKVKTYFPQQAIAAAQIKSDKYTCPMHPEIVGKKNDLCPKCGMILNQMVRILPSNSDSGRGIRASVRMESPLIVGQPATIYLRLTKPDGFPLCLSDLIETHTKKIHLLIVDSSLTDYHHEHPQPTEKLGEYVFTFMPQKPGSYRAWADLRTYPLGLQEYAATDIPAATTGLPLTDRTLNNMATVDGLNFEFILGSNKIKAGQVTHAKLRITAADGTAVSQLEPVMGAFAHIVGFNENYKTVMHIHPQGAPVLDANARGGPELEFQIYALQPGFVRLFAQVQIDGQSRFAPFGVRVAR